MQEETTPGGSSEDVNATPNGDFHEHSEVVEAYDALARDEKRKLLNVEHHLRGGTSLGVGELFRDAVARAVLGERRWPRHVPFVAFIVMTMRSIASHERARLQRSVSIDDVREGEIAKGVVSGAKAPTPEDRLMSQETVRAIQSHFENDEKALSLLLGWGDGLRGKELREWVEVDQVELDYLSKRVRRTLRRLYPNGWGA